MRFFTVSFCLLFCLGLVVQAQTETTTKSDEDRISFLLGLGSKKKVEPETTESESVDLSSLSKPGYTLSEIYPNPTSQEFSLSLQVERTQDIEIEILDAAGKVLDRLHQGPAHANLFNDFTFKWSAPGTGIYSVRILGEDFEVSKGLMMQ